MKISRKLTTALLGVIASAAVISNAAAHPHVWIFAYSDAVFDENGQVIALNIEWEFDEFYSVVAIEGLDVNENGTYEDSELRPLATANLEALKEWDYFTKVAAGSEELTFGDISDYGSYVRNGVLTLHFILPLADPADPTEQTISYKMYDPTFYIAIDYANSDALASSGAIPDSCEMKLLEADADKDEETVVESYYESMLESGTIGAIYAQTAVIACNGEPSL